MKISLSTFYYFTPLKDKEVLKIQSDFFEMGKALEIRGLFIVACEGCNSTFSGSAKSVDKYKKFLNKYFSCELHFKDSTCDFHPFHDLKIKRREEIVSLGNPSLTEIKTKEESHLSPKEWHKEINSGEALILDTRNNYEFEVGHFKGAVNPELTEFNEFSKYVEKSEIPKDKKILMYCTGGIRCEKALLEMNKQGYKSVYQLHGGIINYINEYPEGFWEGECFVFDYRIALDKKLKPTTQWKLCPHCGDPAQKRLNCLYCGEEEVVCEDCQNQAEQFNTCSKNCAHHFAMGHKFKSKHKDSHKKRKVLRD